MIADEELRAQRAAARGHAGARRADGTPATQEEKAQRATYVVVNDGTVAELEAKLSAILDMLSG